MLELSSRKDPNVSEKMCRLHGLINCSVCFDAAGRDAGAPPAIDPIIADLLCKAIAKVRRIPTDKKNAAQGWSYASSDAIIGEAREILCQVGLYPTARVIGLRFLETAHLAVGFAQVEMTTMAPAARSLVEIIEWPVIVGGNGVPNRDLGRALEGAITKAEGLYWRMKLMMDRGDPSTDVDDDLPTNQARRDSARRDRKNPPRGAADAGRPSPPPTDGVDRLAREERLSVLRGLIKRMPSHEAAAHELGFADLAEIKTLGMDELVRATRVLTTWLEERAKRDAAAPTDGALPWFSSRTDVQPEPQPEPPPPAGPPEGSPEYYAARAAAKGPRHG